MASTFPATYYCLDDDVGDDRLAKHDVWMAPPLGDSAPTLRSIRQSKCQLLNACHHPGLSLAPIQVEARHIQDT